MFKDLAIISSFELENYVYKKYNSDKYIFISFNTDKIKKK